MNNELYAQSLFPSNIYWIENPEYLNIAREVSYDHITKSKKNDFVHSIRKSEHINDERLNSFIQYVCAAGYTILETQGFDMTNLVTVCTELWCQDHEKYSVQEERVHGFINQLTGMYILDTPENCPQLVVYDPRPAKRIINMHQKDASELTYASPATYFEVKQGTFIFMNSWLPHGFTRNYSFSSFRSLNFNLSVTVNPNQQSQESNNNPVDL